MCGRSTSVLLRRAYMAGVGQAELGAFDNQERALAKILWRATWGHGMRMDRRPIAASGGYAVRRVETGVGNGSSMSVDACENLVCLPVDACEKSDPVM